MTLVALVEVAAAEKVGAASSILLLTIEMLSTSVPYIPYRPALACPRFIRPSCRGVEPPGILGRGNFELEEVSLGPLSKLKLKLVLVRVYTIMFLLLLCM